MSVDGFPRLGIGPVAQFFPDRDMRPVLREGKRFRRSANILEQQLEHGKLLRLRGERAKVCLANRR